MKDFAADSPAQEFQNPPPGNQWKWKTMLLLILLAILAHVALIGFFGTRSQITPRVVSRVPRLQLAADRDPLIALGDPTLFVLPNPRDFASAIWLRIPAVKTPHFSWSEPPPPRWLSLDKENPAATFEQLLPASPHPSMPSEVKPPPPMNLLPAAIGASLPSHSSLTILGPLAGRGLTTSLALPSLPYDDVIPPSRIQVLVDQSGRIVSAILLPSTESTEAIQRCDAADQRALGIAKQLRFNPDRRLDLGEILFNWRTVPAHSSNSPSGL
jgi:hypothetical protein